MPSALKAVILGLVIAAGVIVGVVSIPMRTPPKPQEDVSAKLHEAEERARKQEEEAQARRAQFEERLTHYGTALQAYARRHPDTEKFWDLVAARKVAIGMPEELVEMAWGKPLRKNDTITAAHKRSQWAWIEDGQYAYFEDGFCVSIQTSR